MVWMIGFQNLICLTHYCHNMLSFIILGLILIALVSYLYANAIDYMVKNHKDYKGEDFLEIKGQPPFDA